MRKNFAILTGRHNLSENPAKKIRAFSVGAAKILQRVPDNTSRYKEGLEGTGRDLDCGTNRDEQGLNNTNRDRKGLRSRLS